MAAYKPKPVPDTWRHHASPAESRMLEEVPIIQEDNWEGVTQADMDEFDRFAKHYASWRATLGNAMQWRVPQSLNLVCKAPRTIVYCPRNLLALKLCGNSPLTPEEEEMVKKYVEENPDPHEESTVGLYIRQFGNTPPK